MIVKTYSELVDKILLVTDQTSLIHKEAFVEYQKLKDKKLSKFKLRRIFHEGDDHIYVYRWNDYFAIEIQDNWTLNQITKLEQLCLELK